MQMHRHGMIAAMCVCAVLALALSCGCTGGDEQPPSGPPARMGNVSGQQPEITLEEFEAQVATLEALGFDLQEVRVAMDAGDPAAAQEAFRLFVREHRDVIPEGIAGPPQAEGGRAPPA
jgi:hypothetical protein